MISRGAHTWTICPFPKWINKELDWRKNIQDEHRNSCGRLWPNSLYNTSSQKEVPFTYTSLSWLEYILTGAREELQNKFTIYNAVFVVRLLEEPFLPYLKKPRRGAIWHIAAIIWKHFKVGFQLIPSESSGCCSEVISLADLQCFCVSVSTVAPRWCLLKWIFNRKRHQWQEAMCNVPTISHFLLKWKAFPARTSGHRKGGLLKQLQMTRRNAISAYSGSRTGAAGELRHMIGFWKLCLHYQILLERLKNRSEGFYVSRTLYTQRR